jgi:hypothetical protein
VTDPKNSQDRGSIPPIVDCLFDEIRPKTVLDLASRIPMAQPSVAAATTCFESSVSICDLWRPILSENTIWIISLGAVGHLSDEERPTLAARTCASARDVILELFTQHGFFLDIDYDAPHSLLRSQCASAQAIRGRPLVCPAHSIVLKRKRSTFVASSHL